jgi:cytidylate kinase
MKCSAERLIEALIAVDLAQERKAAEKRASAARKATYVVTVSRGYGSLGKQVAQALADRLGVRACDRSILEEVASRANVDLELVTKLDETVRHSRIEPWKDFFVGQSFSEERYLHHLVKVVMNISRKGGVIIGRGAHLILGPKRAFRVRIIGSPEICAQRIAERRQLDLDAAKKRVEIIDRQRAEYVQKLYGVDSADNSVFDLVINSDRFGLEQIVELILKGMQLAGYEISPDILKSAP